MRRRKNLLFLLCAFLLIIVLCLIALNIFLESSGKAFVQKRLSNFTKRGVQLKGLHYNPIQGLVFENLVINKYQSDEPFLSFKALTLKPSIFALLFKKNLVFFGEIIPTRKFLLHILCSGRLDLNTKELNISFKIRQLPFLLDLKDLNGNLKLYKNVLEIGISSEKALLGGIANIVDKNGGTELKGSLEAPYILLNELQVYNLHSNLFLRNDKLYVRGINFKLYDGDVEANTTLDLADPKGPFNLNIEIKGADLERFSKNSSLAKKEIKGRLNSKFNIKGELSELKNVRGKGYVEIKDGDFWQTSIFKGIAQIFYLPELQNVSFKEGYSYFILEDGYIKSRNTRLLSDQVTLILKGKISFWGELDIILQAVFKGELVKSSKNFSKVAAILLDKAGQFIGEVKITGSFSQPRFTIIPISLDRIIQKVKDIFEGILK